MLRTACFAEGSLKGQQFGPQTQLLRGAVRMAERWRVASEAGPAEQDGGKKYGEKRTESP